MVMPYTLGRGFNVAGGVVFSPTRRRNNRPSNPLRWGVLWLGTLAGMVALTLSPALAETRQSTPLPVEAPAPLTPPGTSLSASVVNVVPPACTTLSNSDLTKRDVFSETIQLPSLWWVRDQLVADRRFARLIRGWSAQVNRSQGKCRVDVVVNRQLWTLLDYLERYEFVNQLGYEFVSQFVNPLAPPSNSYGYEANFFDRPPEANFFALTPKEREARLLASYECLPPGGDAPMNCRVGGESFNQSGFRLSP